MMKNRLLFLASCLLCFSMCLGDEEVTSANGSDRLLEFYERFPSADTNGDGVLTVDEMHDFLKATISDGSTSQKGEKETGKESIKGAVSKIKSRVFLAKLLEKSPDADNNPKDGVLTKQEILDYVLSQRKIINAKGEKVPDPRVIAAQQKQAQGSKP